jgi:hypothetical protein
VATGATTTFANWLFEKLHDGSLLHRAPWSSALNIGRLADAYSRSGFTVRLISSEGAAADGLDLTDVVVCEVLGVGCTHGKATWSAYGRRRTYETEYDSLAHSAMLALNSLGCTPRPSRPTGGRALQAAPGSTVGQGRAKALMRRMGAESTQLVADGAVTRCSDVGALEGLFSAFDDAQLFRRHGGAVLHWHGRRNTSRVRTFCELETGHARTRAALLRMAARLGYVCAASDGVKDGKPPRDASSAQSSAQRPNQRPSALSNTVSNGRPTRHARGSAGDAAVRPVEPHAGESLVRPTELHAATLEQLHEQLNRHRGAHHASWFFGTLCSAASRCTTLDSHFAALVEASKAGREYVLDLQAGGQAVHAQNASASAVRLSGACEQPALPTLPAPSPRMLYTLLTNPFAGERCCYRNTHDQPQGPVPPHRVLSLHVESLAALPSRVTALMLLMPYDDARPPTPGYLDVGAAAARLPFPASLRVLPNNSLGSYGMYLHAFAVTRERFDYYLFAEDDYLPMRAHYDSTLVRLFHSAFGGATRSRAHRVVGDTHRAVGCLAGILQGRPAEPESRFPLHLESSHLMSAAAIDRLFAHIFERQRWNGSTASYMHHRATSHDGWRSSGTYYGNLQLGFGRLLTEVGIPTRDWTAAYRTPYWNHHQLVDWTGPMHGFTVPPERVLIAPMQWLFDDRLKQCCSGSDCDMV